MRRFTGDRTPYGDESPLCPPGRSGFMYGYAAASRAWDAATVKPAVARPPTSGLAAQSAAVSCRHRRRQPGERSPDPGMPNAVSGLTPQSHRFSTRWGLSGIVPSTLAAVRGQTSSTRSQHRRGMSAPPSPPHSSKCLGWGAVAIAEERHRAAEGAAVRPPLARLGGASRAGFRRATLVGRLSGCRRPDSRPHRRQPPAPQRSGSGWTSPPAAQLPG